MRHLLFSACIASLLLSGSAPAFADDPEGCDMLCRLKGYLATDHMTPAPADAAGPRAGGAKHTRSVAAARKPKPGIAAVPAASKPKLAVAKPSAAAKSAEVPATHPEIASVDTKPPPPPALEHRRSNVKTATHPAKTAVATRTAAPETPEQDAVLPVAAKTPSKRAANRVVMPAVRHSSAPPPVQTATAADITTSPTAPIPGSAPLVAAGFR